jgi:hypothetical protein
MVFPPNTQPEVQALIRRDHAVAKVAVSLRLSRASQCLGD